ncbi:hypothetical protein DICVIV_04286 [Dictyocaulus viviparus]|uniref:RNase NYN domain-containing protein n=1 Tax=Dictyocaulus viviparus TaxID=29172 RepID=A0A0D8XYI2_DICVI|nr:hypothetical protein DICVIV_04286 [Dictyocaulus viviparus]
MSEEACFIKPGPEWLPRLIVIDGCNIGRSACGIGREAVNCAGLMAVIRWLLVRDFDVVAFLPVVYNNSHNFNAVHVHLLTKLEELGLVTFTPARTGRGDRKAFINYDDLYVTTLAARHGGCVLSGDKFKDILAQPAYSEFHPVILHRTLDVKFHFLPHEVVYHKVDVFYKALPELFIYEDIAVRAKMIAQKIFACPDDPEFSKVLMRRELWSEKRKEERINAIDDMMAEICERNAIRPLALESLPGYDMKSYCSGDDVSMEDVFVDQIRVPSNSRSSGTLMDELWSDTTSSHVTTNTTDFALIDFSDDYVSSPVYYHQDPFEHPMDPFDVIPANFDQNNWDHTDDISHCETNGRFEYSMGDLNGQMKNACCQENILQEIVAHIDTLITTRDRTIKRECVVNSTNTSDLLSLSDCSSSETEQHCSNLPDTITQSHLQRLDDNAETTGSGRWPVNAFLEEEISYNGNNHNEDANCEQSVNDPEIEAMLISIFPANVVQRVLAVNVSRNIDFLADQCAEQCA